jgi:hypothetical protein
MIALFEELNGVTRIKVDFSDEGVNLQGETEVKGDRQTAERYVHIFEADLRRNFSELFPVPEPETNEGGEET